MVTGSNSESEKSANKRVNGKLFIDEHAHGALLQECQQSMNNVAVLNVSHLRSCFFFGFHCSTYDQTYDQIFDGVGINIILLLLYCFVDFDTTAGCVISAVVAQFTQRALLAV
jgi:hypothetical protein